MKGARFEAFGPSTSLLFVGAWNGCPYSEGLGFIVWDSGLRV